MLIRLGDAKVINSRFFNGQNVVWRRRKTVDGTIFTTRERLDLTGKIVIKHNNRPTESYQPVKLLQSLISTLSHRKDAPEAAWALLITVENRIMSALHDIDDELSSDLIARAVLDTLKAYDIDAYITYGRYHSNLVSKNELLKALD